MENKRPYEEIDQHFSQLPRPDENAAWEKMKAMLDEEEDDDRFIVLPPFLHGCGGWALVLLLLLGGGVWMYLHRAEEKKIQTKDVTPQSKNEQVPIKAGNGSSRGEVFQNRRGVRPGQKATDATNGTIEEERKENESVDERPYMAPVATSGTKTVLKKLTGRQVKRHGHPDNPRVAALSGKVQAKTKRPKPAGDSSQTEPLLKSNIYVIDREKEEEVTHTPVAADTIVSVQDTAAMQLPVPATDSVKTKTPRKGTKKKQYLIGAGVVLQQQLPLGGQQWTPYNYLGRKGSLADYIPSVYVRIYGQQKWFLQGEFKYGAPQYTKEFVYSKISKKDSMGVVRASTSYRLKKTYYHQLPLSINYMVQPAWSVGAGVVYNRFYGAVSEKEERAQVTAQADTLVSKTMVRDQSDSLFRSNNLQLLLETQYQWKRFSVGARFMQGLQPFIEYTDAQGRRQKQKNYSVNLFIRYELWRQKR